MKMIENELVKVVNGFLPEKMIDKFENFSGETESSLTKCGI